MSSGLIELFMHEQDGNYNKRLEKYLKENSLLLFMYYKAMREFL